MVKRSTKVQITTCFFLDSVVFNALMFYLKDIQKQVLLENY